MRTLITNAIKFSPAGGTITLTAFNGSSETPISVTANRIEMSEEALSKVFSYETSIHYGTGGKKRHGFELLICKEFVERHNGSITVSSQPGKGSTFAIYLPHPPK